MKKTIKNISLYIFTLCASTLFISTISNAQMLSSQAGTAGGTTVTLLDTNGSGPGLTYNPSPAILIAVTSTPTAYAINSMNSTIANGDRNEYSVWSGNTGYYQGVNADSAAAAVALGDFLVDLAADTPLTSTPFGALTNMGGGGS